MEFWRVLTSGFSPVAEPDRGLEDIARNAEVHMGKISVAGRYHREPQRLEDDYVICSDVLGSGMNGKVMLATSKSAPSQKFAVKTIKFDGANEKQMELVKAEVEIYLHLDHPHITRLYDVYESGDQLCLVMECMEGGELFDRLKAQKRFSEQEARDTLCQMLSAVNYMHSHGMVHRDIKLENFVYATKDGNHLKLIDFGFSTKWSPNSDEKMTRMLGTMSYVAPEVLCASYTNQCDLWGLGVVGFILMSGAMPFYGSDAEIRKNISAGNYKMRPDRWNHISAEGKSFIQSLLTTDPDSRLTARQALNHAWMASSHELPTVVSMGSVAQKLQEFSRASVFRRCCLRMLAWSLPHEAQAKVYSHFLSLDSDHQGKVTLGELKDMMVHFSHQLNMPTENDSTLLQLLQSVEYAHDDEIHYSEFLAAMQVEMGDVAESCLKAVFRRFDKDGSGFITAKDLSDVIGSDAGTAASFIREVDRQNQGYINFADFSAYLRNEPHDVTKVAERQSQMASLEGMLKSLQVQGELSPAIKQMMASTNLHSVEPKSEALFLWNYAQLAFQRLVTS